MVEEIGSLEAFNDLLRRSGDTPVVLEHYALWCSPCKALAPLFAQLQITYPGFVFVKCDADKGLFHVDALPRVDIYVRGQVVKQVYGANLKEIEAALNTVLQQPSQPESQPAKKPKRDDPYKRYSDL